MQNYIETKVSYTEVTERGTHKRRTDAYLVEADTFTEAEARTIAEVGPTILGGEYNVTAARRVRFGDVVRSDSGRADLTFYDVRFRMEYLDGRTQPLTMLVEAPSIGSALARAEEAARRWIASGAVTAIAERPRADIFMLDDAERRRRAREVDDIPFEGDDDTDDPAAEEEAATRP